MKLRVNPILKKELKLGARTFKFPLGISVYGMIFSLISLLNLISNTRWLTRVWYGNAMDWGYISYNSLNSGFTVLAIMQVVMLCIIVPVLTASSIAGERERQTLDIMLTAPVSSFSIAFGKLTAALANVFMFIISTLPALSLCFLYGGIEWKYLIIFIVNTMALAFFVGAIGVWCSAIFKRTIVSVIMTMIFEGIFYILPFIGYIIIYVMKYQNAVAALAEGQSVKTVEMGWTGLVLIFSPFLTSINTLIKSVSSKDLISSISTGMFDLTKPAQNFENFLPFWNWVGFAIMIILGFFFLYLTARRIDAPGKKH